MTPLRIAAINFLNPAPLMWDLEHPPVAPTLADRYHIHRTSPALAAQQLLSGDADLGLIPVAALTPELAIVPGCAIASLSHVRSIQLIVKSLGTAPTPPVDDPLASLRHVRTVAADTASRSSVAYAQVLFRNFAETSPGFVPCHADPVAMLRHADAALLIGDPALLALEHRAPIEAAVGPCTWIDLAHAWRQQTGLPWVAAVWAVHPDALTRVSLPAAELIADLNRSRNHGLDHIDDLVHLWSPRIAIPPATIRHYLTRNIHYHLDADCIRTIELFRHLAAEVDALPALPGLRFLS